MTTRTTLDHPGTRPYSFFNLLVCFLLLFAAQRSFAATCYEIASFTVCYLDQPSVNLAWEEASGSVSNYDVLVTDSFGELNHFITTANRFTLETEPLAACIVSVRACDASGNCGDYSESSPILVYDESRVATAPDSSTTDPPADTTPPPADTTPPPADTTPPPAPTVTLDAVSSPDGQHLPTLVHSVPQGNPELIFDFDRESNQWSKTGGSFSNDSSIYVQGTGSLEHEVRPDRAYSMRRDNLAGFDWRGQELRVWMRASDYSMIGSEGIFLRLSHESSTRNADDWTRWNMARADFPVPADGWIQLRFNLGGAPHSTEGRGADLSQVHAIEFLVQGTYETSKHLWTHWDQLEVVPPGISIVDPGNSVVPLALGLDSGGLINLHSPSPPFGLLETLSVGEENTSFDTRPAWCDLEGDGDRELVVGLGRGSDGEIEIRGNQRWDYVLKATLRAGWNRYHRINGETYPACGDIDGDGRDELVIGFGQGSDGYVQVLDDASHDYAHLAWLQLSDTTYRAANGLITPSLGDIDGDGLAEVVLGLGRGGEGRYHVMDDANAGYDTMYSHQLDWPEYNQASGATHPAIGDVNGDGDYEILTGLSNGNSRLHLLDGADSDFEDRGWIEPFTPHNSDNSMVPILVNVDSDAGQEIIAGVSSWLSVGIVFALDDGDTHFAPIPIPGSTLDGWLQLDLPTNAQEPSALRPAPGTP